MNEKLRLTLNVTKWEFYRFFKWIDLLKGAFYMVLFGLFGIGGSVWLGSDTFEEPVIAVSNFGVYDSEELETQGFQFTDQTGLSENELEDLLNNESADAILEIVSVDSVTLRAKSERAWFSTLRVFLNEKRTQKKLQELNIDEDRYKSIEEGVAVQAIYSSKSSSSSADKVVAGISILLVLMAVFMGFAYQFTAITAEKQQRITEQVISAIDPQTWIDGKIFGITSIGLVYVVFYGGLGLVGTFVIATFTGLPVGDALAHINPLLVLLFLILSCMGVIMWNCFFAAIAATINDPNSSERTGMMMLPMLPVLFAFFSIINPDSVAIRVLGIFPLTSYAVLPPRMVLSQVYLWEIILALVLLAVTIWLFRVGAGKIFAVSMMMYGKEPSIKEMAYWFKKS